MFDVHDAVDRPCHKSQTELSLIDLSFQRGRGNGTIFFHLQTRRGHGSGTDSLAPLPHVLHIPLKEHIILKAFSGINFFPHLHLCMHIKPI